MTDTLTLDPRVEDRPNKVSVVDCDIHPVARSMDDMKSYLSKEWQEYTPRYGLGYGLLWASHLSWFMANRPDASPTPDRAPVDLLRAQVLDEFDVGYGILNHFGYLIVRHPPEYAADGARAINDWLTAEYLDPDDRLLGSIIVPWEQPDLAVREINRRASDRRWAQVIMPSEAMEPLGSRKYWPIYEAAANHGLPMACHIAYYDHHLGTGWPSYVLEAYYAMGTAMRRQLMNIVCEGLFDAIPGTRLVLIEAGVGWAVSLKWQLDSAFEMLGSEVGLKRKPSEYLDEFVWFTTQPMEDHEPEHFAQAIEHGHLADRLLFATDWPHYDFDSPLRALPRSLPQSLRERILGGNASELYGLPR